MSAFARTVCLTCLAWLSVACTDSDTGPATDGAVVSDAAPPDVAICTPPGTGTMADWCTAFCATYANCFEDSPTVPDDPALCFPWCEAELGDCGPEFIPEATCCLNVYCSLLEECVFRGPGAHCF